jgi:predicted ATPase/class 3 adenylate cyclase
MSEFPTGTVSFLFTDIEGSTRLWEQQPEAMQVALTRHEALAAQLIREHDGVLVKHRGEGDSLFAVFARAVDAVAAAVGMQRGVVGGGSYPVHPPRRASAMPGDDGGAALTPQPPLPILGEGESETADSAFLLPLRVRMAIHTGDAALRDGDYFGGAVNRCARLREAAHGGQIVLSAATQELVRDQLPEGVSLRDLGECRLRDLSRPERIVQVVAPDLPSEFPPLRTLDAVRQNLPSHLTPLLGREREVADACARLRGATRLLTLTGPGGTGKTRLAQQVAAELLDDFDGGVYFVDLAPIRDPELVVPTIAQTLGLRETGGQSIAESLKAYLREKQFLLVLDNFEQILPAAPQVVDLLAAAPGLKALVTSRAALRVRGEQEAPVSPLSLPDRKRLPGVEALSQYAAVALFIERAVAVRPDFAVTNENAPAVAEICHRLDGLPLAIELAAARVRLFPPQALLSRLESRLKLLTGGPRDVPARQQTLRDAIAWSYDLLSHQEQAFFRRLSVFTGGFTMEAAEAICAEENVFDLLTSLIEKSLVRQGEYEDEPRFGMLETIREFGQERLSELGEEAAVRWEHVEFYLGLAERAEPRLETGDQMEWFARLEQEHDNLRTALTWSLAALQGGETALRFVAALSRFWYIRGYAEEGPRWATAALAHPAASHARTRARALWGSGQLAAFTQGDFAAVLTLAEESVALWQSLGDPKWLGRALALLGLAQRNQSGPAAGRPAAEQSVAILRTTEDAWGLAFALLSHGVGLLRLGEEQNAVHALDEAAVLARRAGDRWGISEAVSWLGDAARSQGEYGQAAAHYRESLNAARGMGCRIQVAFILLNLAWTTLHQGDDQGAAALVREGLDLACEVGCRPVMALGAAAQAGVALAQGRSERAVRLLGAVKPQIDGVDAMLSTADVADLVETEAGARAAIGEEAFAMAWAEGRAMTLEQAICVALEEREAAK